MIPCYLDYCYWVEYFWKSNTYLNFGLCNEFDNELEEFSFGSVFFYEQILASSMVLSFPVCKIESLFGFILDPMFSQTIFVATYILLKGELLSEIYL